MGARWPVEMPAQWLCFDSVLSPDQEPFQVQMDRSRLLYKGRRYHDLYTLVLCLLILRHVLSLEVRIDRYVSLTTSAYWWDKIKGYCSPFAAEALKSLF